MARRHIARGSRFEELLNYARVVVDGEWIFVSGCSGFDYDSMEIADNITDQAEQAFRNIDWCLAEAGAAFPDVVRLRVMVASLADYPAAMAVIGRRCAEARPANTTWIAALPDPRIRIEIEATALKRRP